MSAGRDGAGPPPGLHALVVGVGAYPYLRGGSSHREGAHRRSNDFTQLTSPPHCAYALADLLKTEKLTEAAAPAASLELLVSEAPDLERKYGSLASEAKRPTFKAIRDAFLRWRERCDEHESNIALFYFCGHGYAVGQQAPVLMPEDFGENRDAFFENGIDLETTMHAVAEFQSRTQIFLIDACREGLDAGIAGQRGRSLADPKNPGFDPAPDLAIVHSAQYGRRAFGRPGTSTTFTDSLLQALRGLGAAPGDRWRIDLESLPPALAKLVRWNTPSGADEGGVPVRDQRSTHYVSGPGRPLRLLDVPPKVPFRITVQPTDAMASAELHLQHHNGIHLRISRTQPSYEMWEGEAIAGNYKMSAVFSGNEYCDTHLYSDFMPPCVERTIDVTPSHDTAEDRSAS